MRRVLTAAMALLGGLAPSLAGQRIWKSSLYPYAYYSSVDGLWGVIHIGRYSPVGFLERPEPNLAGFSVDLSASTGGSYLIVADAQAPAWWDGWRVGVTLTAARANRLGYYGIGNATTYSADSVTALRPYFYRVSRTSSALRATVQHRLAGPARVLVGAGLERTSFRDLPGATVFEQDVTAGAVDSSRFSDAAVRAGLVVDTRDNELDPHRGVFLEGLYTAGNGYTRRTASARAFINPVETLTIAARLAGETMGGGPPVALQMTMESSERPYTAVGGFKSLRGYYDGRFTGAGKLLGGVEVRYAVLWAPSLFELKLVGFYDAARVFGPGEDFRITTDGLHTSGGAELAARILRNTIVVVGYGRGREGGQLLVGSSWSY